MELSNLNKVYTYCFNKKQSVPGDPRTCRRSSAQSLAARLTRSAGHSASLRTRVYKRALSSAGVVIPQAAVDLLLEPFAVYVAHY